MTNIDTYIKALQIKWILRLLENSNENWKIIPQNTFVGDKSRHNFKEIRKQIIWGNKYIKYKGKCLVKVG